MKLCGVWVVCSSICGEQLSSVGVACGWVWQVGMVHGGCGLWMGVACGMSLDNQHNSYKCIL